MPVTLPALPSIPPRLLGLLLLAFLAGMTVPTRYGLLRLRGFGRLCASKIPAKPPAGKDREKWLREGTQCEPDQPDQSEAEP